MLTSLLQASATMEAHAQQLLQQARRQAQALLEEARREAQALLREAQAQHKAGYAQGFEQGQHESLQAWTARAVASATHSQRVLDKQRDRLGRIVAMAVQRVVEQEDRQALFQRALRSVSRLVQEVPLLTLRVHEEDCDSARRAVDAVLGSLGGTTQIEVVADGRLARGSCLFESDQGVIDAGLQTQLAAIERAALKASQATVLEADVPACSEDALPAAACHGDTAGS